MAEATFSPQAPVGYVSDRASKGFDEGQSMMERAQKRRMAEQVLQQQRAEEAQAIIMRPLEIAKTKADLANNAVQYQSALNMQQTEAELAPLIGTAQTEFNNLMKITDPNLKADAALEFSGKYAQFKNTKKWGQQFAAYDSIAKELYTENIAISKLKEEAWLRADMQKAQIAGAAEVARIRTGATQQAAATRAANKPTPTMQKFSEGVGTKAAEYYTGAQEKVAEHQRTLDTIASSRELLASGAAQGAGEGFKTDLMQGINALTRSAGVSDLFDTSKRETLQRNYSDLSLAAAARMKNQGQITESERKLLQNTVARYGNSPKAATFIMDYMEAVANREIQKADYLKEQVDARGMVDQSAEAQFYQQNPISYFLPIRGDEKGGVKADGPIEIKSIKLISPNG